MPQLDDARRAVALTAGLGVSCFGLLTWPLLLVPGHLLAHSAGEGDNHLWMHWQAAHPDTVWANVPVGTPLPLMDPVNLPLFAAGFAVSPAFAWSLAWSVSVLLALVGGGVLGGELAGHRGARMGMVVLGAAPFLHGVGAFGLTEAWPLGWLALALAALHRWARTGGWLPGLAASASLCLFAAGGWYHAAFAALGAPVAVGWARPRGRRWLGLLGIALGAALPLLPRFFQWWSLRAVWADRWQVLDTAPAAHAGWRAASLTGGTDLLNLVLPSLTAVPASKAVYLGLVALVCGGVALHRREAGARWLAGGVGLFALLALGRWVTVGGLVLPVQGPAGWLTTVLPPLSGLTHWYRAVGPAMVLLAALAALGARHLPGWLPLLVLLESLALSQNPWPREHYDPRPPADLLALEGEGALVLLPFDNGRAEFGTGVPRLYDRWGPWLARPLSEHYEGRDALLANRLIAAADEATGAPRGEGAPAPRGEATLSPGVLQGAVAGLQRAGVQWVVLLNARAPTADASADVLRQGLGEPEVVTGQLQAWRVGVR